MQLVLHVIMSTVHHCEFQFQPQSHLPVEKYSTNQVATFLHEFLRGLNLQHSVLIVIFIVNKEFITLIPSLVLCLEPYWENSFSESTLLWLITCIYCFSKILRECGLYLGSSAGFCTWNTLCLQVEISSAGSKDIH